MKINFNTAENIFDNRNFGWYIYAYIDRDNNIKSRYETDQSLVSILFMSLKQYREIAKNYNSISLANGRTCFKSKSDAEAIIPLLQTVINYNVII